MYNVLDIAKYVVNYSHEIGASITNLKLQKLLYYIQAAFLVEKRERCFEERILAWEFGPVSVEAYNEYKHYGREEIPEQNPREEVEFDGKTFTIKIKQVNINNKLKVFDKKLVEKVVEAYKKVTDPFELVKKTHSEKPWQDTVRNDEIKCEKIKEYYSHHIEKIYN